MEPHLYIYLSISVFLLLFVIIPSLKERTHNIIRINKKKKSHGGELKMTNELIKNYVGKNCIISCGGWSSVQGEIVNVVDNWLEITTKKNNQLINADYITNITEIKK